MNHIVFDLDGTLSDTQSIHQQVEAEFLSQKWATIDPESIGVRYAGRTPQEWMSEYLHEKNISFDPQELEDFVHQKDTIVISRLRAGAIELMPFVADTIEILRNREYTMGISSWACRQFIDEFVERFNFTGILSASTSANEVQNKKPHPDVFHSTFVKLEASNSVASKKYVVGDGWSDVQGGKAAWATTIWFNQLWKPKKDPTICDFEIQSFDELLRILP